jgi:hypothetical protein
MMPLHFTGTCGAAFTGGLALLGYWSAYLLQASGSKPLSPWVFERRQPDPLLHQ